MSVLRLKLWVVLGCAASLLIAQFTGTHYHRHLEHGDQVEIQAIAEGGTTIHLRDGGVHTPDVEGTTHVHTASDRTSHPGVDIEIDPVVDGLSKAFKSALFAGLALAILFWFIATPRPMVGFGRIRTKPIPRRVARFALRPPSQAPPVFLVQT